MTQLLLQIAVPFSTTLLMITLLSRAASRIGLIDRPSGRKNHEGNIAVVGGIAIWAGLGLSAAIFEGAEDLTILVNERHALWLLVLYSAFLTFVGALDDRFRLSVWLRTLMEISLAILVVETFSLELRYLGDILAIGIIKISPTLAFPITVIFIFGVINSFNMLDGLDGLLASLVLVTLSAFHLMTGSTPSLISIAIGSSLVAFLISNLGLVAVIPKTFLGDAGSKLLGFIVVCLLLGAASVQVGGQRVVQPITALFLIAVPLFDMVCAVVGRLFSGRSPFQPDRSHIHHLLQDCGHSPTATLKIILTSHITFVFTGLFLHQQLTPEIYQLSVFLACFCLYAFACRRLHRRLMQKSL